MPLREAQAPLRVVIVGAGGQGRVVADALLALAASRLVPVAFVDDDRARSGTEWQGIGVLGPIDALSEIPHDALVVAIGDNDTRARVTDELVARGERLVTVQHPRAIVASEVQVGDGCMLSAGAVVTPGVRMGRGVLVNTRAVVDHDSLVGDFAHIAVGVSMGGAVVVGERALIGVGAVVMPGRRVGARTIVGAGAVVVHDLPDDVVAIGAPARVRRTRS